MTATSDIKATVRDRYGKAALNVLAGDRAGCCGAGAAFNGAADPITRDLYDALQAEQLPSAAVLASLGCGNPTALAELRPGETVLDLGSGGGIDVLLSARRVGPTGMAFGLDMTDEMLDLARRNAAEAGVTNVHFLKGDIERIPLPNASVDVIISNCVINLAADKRAVLREAFRVLKPGGRFAVSDIVTRADLPTDVQRNAAMWCGCVAGALPDRVFLDELAAAGFVEADIEPTREYSRDDLAALLSEAGLDDPGPADRLEGAVYSGFIRATKPRDGGAPKPAATARACGCGPECCA